MKKNIIFLEPVFKSMIWGGNKLAAEYGYDIPTDTTGECWAVSAHKNGDCLIKRGDFAGKTLSWLWDNHRELFGDASQDVFPLLIKIIDAKADLSIQVHPDDAYAMINEGGALGKTECWYILNCEENAEIVIGHNAKDKTELRNMIRDNQWKDLIRVRPIHKGDFFQIEPGTVHAIKKGTMILETQQNSDITYRLYDYGRLENGKPRQLHIEKSIDVIHCPYVEKRVRGDLVKNVNCDVEELISCNYYTVQRMKLHGEQKLLQEHKFMNVSVIEGSGSVDSEPVRKGDHFLLLSGDNSFLLKGNMELIVSYI